MKLHLATINSLSQQVENLALSSWLGEDENLRAQRLKGHRRRQYISGRIMLRKLLSEVGHEEPQFWQLKERQDLPPKIIVAQSPQLYFSISHSRENIAVIVSDQQALAIDVESLRKRDFVALASYFHPSEAQFLSALDDVDQCREFYRLWTLKEACIKLQMASIFSDLPRRLVFEATEQHFSASQSTDSAFKLIHCLRNNVALSIARAATSQAEEIKVSEVDLSIWPPQHHRTLQPLFSQYEARLEIAQQQ